MVLVEDVLFAGLVDDVVYGEKVVFVFQFSDQLQFVLDLCSYFGVGVIWPVLVQVFFDLVMQLGGGIVVGRY